MSKLQTFSQFGDCEVECFRYYLDIAKSQVSLASFDATQISAIQSALRCERFLRKALLRTQLANSCAEPLENIVSLSHQAK